MSGVREKSAVAEIFGIGVGIAEIIVDEDRRLPRQLEAFSAFEASHQVIEPHHEGSSLGKLSAIFFASAAWQFPLLPRNLPAHGKFKFAAATRADELDLPGFFLFRVKGAFVHGYVAGTLTASSIVTNSRPRSRQRGSQYSSAARVGKRSAFSWR
jgi:hypothetical protein